jgi:hypothetical protein
VKLFVDDLRDPPEGWEVARTSREAVALLKSGQVTELSLEHDFHKHDFHSGNTTRPIVIWMIIHDVWPEIVRCHTTNPVGREWIERMISRYKREMC